MPDTHSIPQLLTIDQLAERLGITVRHVRRLVAERRVPYLKVGKLVRFDPDQIAAWLHTTCQPEVLRPVVGGSQSGPAVIRRPQSGWPTRSPLS